MSFAQGFQAGSAAVTRGLQLRDQREEKERQKTWKRQLKNSKETEKEKSRKQDQEKHEGKGKQQKKWNMLTESRHQLTNAQ